MTWVLVSGRELNCGVSERTLTKLSGLGKLCLGLSLWQSIDLCRMMLGALVFRSVVLIMHAVLLVPSSTFCLSLSRFFSSQQCRGLALRDQVARTTQINKPDRLNQTT